MKRVVFKKLAFQVLIIFLLTFVPIQLFNKVLGPNNISYVIADSPKTNSNELVVIHEVNRLDLSKARAIISALNGYDIFETDGYLEVLKVSENKYILFNTNNTSEILRLYLLDSTNFKVEDITSQIKLPKVPSQLLENFEYISNNFCLYYKINNYLFDCYMYKDQTISKVDTSDINSKIVQIKSNKYYVEKSYEANTSYRLRYISDNNEFDQEALLSFRIIDGRINISEDRLSTHIVDNQDFDKSEIPSNYSSSIYTFPSYTSERVISSGYILKRYQPSEYQSDYNDELNPFISNPLIGSQFIEHKGVKYMSWFSTFNFNQIQAGIIGNNTIFVRVNNSMYFIDEPSMKIFKLNTKKDFENGSPIHIVYL